MKKKIKIKKEEKVVELPKIVYMYVRVGIQIDNNNYNFAREIANRIACYAKNELSQLSSLRHIKTGVESIHRLENNGVPVPPFK